MIAVVAWGLARLARALGGSTPPGDDRPQTRAAERAPRADTQPTPA
jgi:hypothetical protein